MKKVHETIIIGAGISGLACARKLHENNKEFLVISEDIGGRIQTSKEGKVNYGAIIILKNFHHVKKFVKITRKIPLRKMRFHEGDRDYKIWNKKLFAHPFQLITFIWLVHKSLRHYEKLKKNCEHMSPIQALKADPFLYHIFHEKTEKIAAEYKNKSILEDWPAKITYGFTSLPFHRTIANQILWGAVGIFLPIYEFTFLKDKMIRAFKKNILIDTITKITKEKEHYLLKTKKKTYQAKNVVVATPPHISKKLLHLKKIKKPVSGHLFHLTGKLKDPSKYGDYNFFSEESPTYLIIKQIDSSYLFYSKNKNPDFKKYFQKHKIIHHKFWNPAYNFEGNIILECEQDKNLYLIGDHNFPSLEDAYITGLYAANQIIGLK
jgi:hypothetical protein